MDSSTFVSSFQLDNSHKLYSKVIWLENETDLFHIEIYDKQNMWTGRFSMEFAERFRDRNQQELEEYRKNVKDSLMNKNNSVFEFVRAIDGDSNAATFIWKSTHLEDGQRITMTHGSVPVHKYYVSDNTNSPETNTIIEFLIDENHNLRRLVGECESNIHQLTEELAKSKLELEKFIDAKNALENSVYEKFIHLLNSKKKRILLLEQNLNELGSEVD